MTMSGHPGSEGATHSGVEGTGPARLVVDAGRLWAGGVATAVVAGLVATVGVLVARGVFGIAVLAPSSAGAWGDASTAWLAGVAAVAALLATGLLHVLLLATPRPFGFFKWIVGLLTTGVALWPFATDAPLGTTVATSLIYLIIGIAIGTLLSSVGVRAVRSGGMYPRP